MHIWRLEEDGTQTLLPTMKKDEVKENVSSQLDFTRELSKMDASYQAFRETVIGVANSMSSGESDAFSDSEAHAFWVNSKGLLDAIDGLMDSLQAVEPRTPEAVTSEPEVEPEKEPEELWFSIQQKIQDAPGEVDDEDDEKYAHWGGPWGL